jgi:hypothetical protein
MPYTFNDSINPAGFSSTGKLVLQAGLAALRQCGGGGGGGTSLFALFKFASHLSQTCGFFLTQWKMYCTYVLYNKTDILFFNIFAFFS